MDPISQTALGIVASEATFRKHIGRSANWLAGLAAFSPDLDTLARRFGADPWFALQFHRGLTHSFAMVPAIALFWTLLFWAFRRKQFKSMYALACLAVLSHPLLDLATSYGTQIFWPFTSQRYAFDFLPIVDIFYTPALLLTIVACFVARQMGRRSLYASEQRRGRIAWRIGLAGLALSSAYAGWGAWIDQETKQLARDTVPAEHGEIEQIRSGPLLGTIFARRIAVKVDGGYYVTRHNVLTSPPQPQWHWAPSADGAEVDRAHAMREIGIFRWFTMHMARPVVDSADDGNGNRYTRVTWYDMRYGYPADSVKSIFKTEVVFDQNGKVVVPPVGPHWQRRGQSPEGVLAHFKQQENPLRLDRGRGERIKGMWHETWRP